MLFNGSFNATGIESTSFTNTYAKNIAIELIEQLGILSK